MIERLYKGTKGICDKIELVLRQNNEEHFCERLLWKGSEIELKD
jgi:hypothetical protein